MVIVDRNRVSEMYPSDRHSIRPETPLKSGPVAVEVRPVEGSAPVWRGRCAVTLKLAAPASMDEPPSRSEMLASRPSGLAT
ncbi:MAG: hypothetical protein SGJ17_09620 [Hyphomicrobiales bacterium]|nr:hypothetical protein [Hyphomicrobiales bacterium]